MVEDQKTESKTKEERGRRHFPYRFMGFLLLLLLIFIQTGILISSKEDISTVVEYKSKDFLPSSFEPRARFAANIDWDKKEVSFDATISKAYKNKIDKFIWRIDDGTGLVSDGKFTHTFKYPGFYTIYLSVIDDQDQSDVASCQILFPPSEVERILRDSSTNAIQEVKTFDNKSISGAELIDSRYVWMPKGTFFNFSKLKNSGINEESIANILSNYVGSDCGLSDRGYNVLELEDNFNSTNSSLRNAVTNLIVKAFFSIVTLIVFLLLKYRFRTRNQKI